jgi:hypothetical protein
MKDADPSTALRTDERKTAIHFTHPLIAKIAMNGAQLLLIAKVGWMVDSVTGPPAY